MANLSGPAAGGRGRTRARVASVLSGRPLFYSWLALTLVVLGLLVVASLPSSASLLPGLQVTLAELLIALGLFMLVARWGRLADPFFEALTFLSTLLILIVMAVGAAILVDASWPTMQQYGWGFLTGNQWVPFPPPNLPEVYSGLPVIYGTLLVAGLAMLIGVPLSLGIAMFLTELSPHVLRAPISFLIELLAAIPSVVYGVWGLIVLVPYMSANVDPWIANHLGGVPVIGGAFAPAANGLSGFNYLTAGIILAIMVIPTISSVTREAFAAVPKDQREAALSLGATRWETTRLAVMPYARRGMFGAITLGLGRAIGETIAVVLVIGNTFIVGTSLLSPGSTIAAWIANNWGEASGLQRNALLELGLILLVMSVAINVGARFLVRQSGARGGARA
jgi:phosphate transport system permease protein